MRARTIILLAGLALLGAASPSAAAPAPEPFFPHEGNAGYDVSHYDVNLAYQPSNGRLRATARIDGPSVPV